MNPIHPIHKEMENWLNVEIMGITKEFEKKTRTLILDSIKKFSELNFRMKQDLKKPAEKIILP